MSDQYLTVKQFAELEGVSTVAVYKRLQTSLVNYVNVVNRGAKSQTLINADALSDEGKQKLINVSKDDKPKLTNVSKPKQTISDADRKTDIVLDALVEQLRVKDEQIKLLQTENAELIKAINELTMVASQSQQLQGHTQKLLSEQTEKPEKVPLGKKFHNFFFND